MIYDFNGKIIDKKNNVSSLDISGYQKGIYIIKTSEGLIQKMIVN